MYSPKVYYFCSCGLSNDSNEPEPQNQISENIVNGLDQDTLIFKKYPLQHLYYCEKCDEIKCEKCVFNEPAVYYCSNCLFEVPSASVRSENNRCGRNCYECPICTQILMVVEGDSKKPNSLGHGTSDTIIEKAYWLQCSVCSWESKEIGWEFSRPTGLSGQISELKYPDLQKKEFERLVTHFETIQQNSKNEADINLLDRQGYLKKQRLQGYGFGSRLFGTNISKQVNAMKDIKEGLDDSKTSLGSLDKPYKAITCLPEDSSSMVHLSQLSDGDSG
ncbi:hypothetical protein BB558_001406 [Smittium angustum]|uniref:Dynactin subunit 4 n=1 Tax=Smittium angustum TaxID=133377 RepID=A0A2U1JBN2_SMIAN|nr:hypothetical protein BB558_001406 [Smittium angustum]